MERKPNKTLAFCLFKYFPYGGLERDMLRIALACQERGYVIEIYTTIWQGPVPQGLRLHCYRPTAVSNHGRMRQYHGWLTRQLADHPPACAVGFQKMPGLDVYYAADGCYKAKALQEHGRLYRLLPRYRLYQAFEDAVFGFDARTQILMLSPTQGALYVEQYGTPQERLHPLPPNLAKDRMACVQAPAIRRTFREALGLKDSDRFLLQLGSGFRTKGLDRSIHTLAALPQDLLTRTRLYVVGAGSPGPYARLARRLGVADRVVFLGSRDDVPQILVAADLLLHPARHENTGTVLVEALAAGLAAVVTGVCGYAPYTERAQAGWVLAEPFDQAVFNRTVQAALERPDLAQIGHRGLDFAHKEDLSGMVETSVRVIEAVAAGSPKSEISNPR